MGKIINTIVFITLGYLLPLAWRPALILHYKVGILIAAALAIFLTQPGFELKEARQDRQQDRNSVLAILLCSLLSAAVPVVEWAYWHPGRHSGAVVAAGLLFIIAGICLRVWAIRTLGAYFTATVRIKEQQSLVQEGPYAIVRHPSYLGALAAILGCAVLLQSWAGLALAAVLMMLAYRLRIEVEEEALVKAFGEQYLQYRKKAKKMIPLLW